MRAGLLVREVEDELLILDAEADQVHQLNRSASLIWRMHNRGASQEEIAERLDAEFEVSAETAKQDTREMLTQLRELALICSDPRPDQGLGSTDARTEE